MSLDEFKSWLEEMFNISIRRIIVYYYDPVKMSYIIPEVVE